MWVGQDVDLDDEPVYDAERKYRNHAALDGGHDTGAAVDGGELSLQNSRTSARQTSESGASEHGESPLFSDAERAALDLAEHVTRLADQFDAVPDIVWENAVDHYDETELSSLLISIAAINVWNRLNAATRQPVGIAS